MEIIISETAKSHIEYWKKTNNIVIQKRISILKEAIVADPYKGVGKPEPLNMVFPELGLAELIKPTVLFMLLKIIPCIFCH